MSVGGLIAGGEVSGKFQSVAEKSSQSSELFITAFISGGRGVVNPSTMEESLSLYKGFSATVLDAGVPYFVTAKPWRELMPTGLSWAESVVRGDTINTAGGYILDAIAARSRLRFILANPHQFVDPDAASLERSQTEIDGLPAVVRVASDCNADTQGVR